MSTIEPLVTVVLCTRNRAEMAARAIRCFQKQNYPNLELVVVEDGEQNVNELLENVPDALYIRQNCRNLSEKRNVGVLHAGGEFIVHFDDDDWQSRDRVLHQISVIRDRPDIDVVGYHTAFFWDIEKRQASCYFGERDYSWGPCLCYRRSYALAHPWPERVSLAEDNVFINPARSSGKLLALDGRGHIVVQLHSGNGERATNTSVWPNIASGEIPAAFFLEFYPCNAAS